ncbi:acyl-CoA thioesterase [Paroceanicella profunda]|nr:thioesterase family protein [Paroceanicella profunda]
MFTLRRQVEFQHCDPAGIVFYPRYFEMISAAVERFFTDHLGKSFAEMHLTEKFGVPTARIEVDFRSPSRLEDWLDLSVAVARVGRSSVELAITCACAGTPRFEARSTLVYVDLTTGKPRSWPDGLRAALGSELTESETQDV